METRIRYGNVVGMRTSETRTIRNSSEADYPIIRKIYADARERMAAEGNGGQWEPEGPPADKILTDIRNGDSYVVLERGKIIGVFSLILGEDPTYGVIQGGWLNDLPYGTIHRIAAAEKGLGLFKDVLDFCFRRIRNIRVDTHRNNLTMRTILEKSGFRECGTIFLESGDPRIAYQKFLDPADGSATDRQEKAE